MSNAQLEELIAHHALKMRIAIPHSENWYWHMRLRADWIREWRQTNTLSAVS